MTGHIRGGRAREESCFPLHIRAHVPLSNGVKKEANKAVSSHKEAIQRQRAHAHVRSSSEGQPCGGVRQQHHPCSPRIRSLTIRPFHERGDTKVEFCSQNVYSAFVRGSARSRS